MGPINHIFSLLCQFENFIDNIKIFTSKKNTDNHLLVFVYSLGPEIINFLKLSLCSYKLSLMDITGVDLTKLNNYNLFFNVGDTYLAPKLFERCIIYNVIDYSNNGRYGFFYFMPEKLYSCSVSDFFYNAHWLERELVEFFNVNIIARSDTRNLLLDYNFTGNPLLKHYPTEGHREIFFNHLSYNLEYVNNEFIEL